MGDGTKLPVASAADLDMIISVQSLDEIGRLDGGVLSQPKEYQVGLDSTQVDFHAGDAGQALSQLPGIGVVLRQTIHHLLQRDNAGRGKYPNLAHPAAQHLARPASAVNEIGRPAKKAADRSTEPLAETKGDAVHMLGDLGKRAHGQIKGGLYYSCLGRGRNQFGEDSEELKMIRDLLGDFPLVGFFANGEISHNRLYGYTGVLTLFVQ